MLMSLNKMWLTFLFLILFVYNCNAQCYSNNVSLIYHRQVFRDSVGYNQFVFESNKNYLFVKYPSASFEKEINIKLSRKDLMSVYEIFKKLKVPEGINCIYNDDMTISSKTMISFNDEEKSILKQKCLINTTDKENFLLVEAKILKLIKSFVDPI